MAVHTHAFELHTTDGTDIFDITNDVERAVGESSLVNGTATVFVPGSTGAVTTVEYEPGAVSDLKSLFERIAPRDIEYAHELAWHDGNGHSHVRAALIGPSLSIPFLESRPILGTWQQVIMIDFDNKSRRRRVLVQVVGE